MIAPRHSLLSRTRALLTLVLMALGVNALVPAGYMVAPTASQGIAVTLCPETHPLARAVAVAEGYAQPDDAASHAHHAAMGHDTAPAHDGEPATAATGTDCAFSALAFAGDIPAQPETSAAPLERAEAALIPLKAFAVAPSRHLRPPLRGPPVHS